MCYWTIYVLLWLAAGSICTPTQVMHRPENYKAQPRSDLATVRDDSLTTTKKNGLHRRSTGYISAGYFTNWFVLCCSYLLTHSSSVDRGIYARNFQPTDIVSSTLTHILYAFADVDPNSGNISLTDVYADEQVCRFTTPTLPACLTVTFMYRNIFRETLGMNLYVYLCCHICISIKLKCFM